MSAVVIELHPRKTEKMGAMLDLVLFMASAFAAEGDGAQATPERPVTAAEALDALGFMTGRSPEDLLLMAAEYHQALARMEGGGG